MYRPQPEPVANTIYIFGLEVRERVAASHNVPALSQTFKHIVYADQMHPIRFDGLSASPNKCT